MTGGGPLSGAELYQWVALRRVSDGRVAKLAGRWRDCGYPVPDDVAQALAGLLTDGLVALVPSARCAGVPRAALTDTGAARFEQLCQALLGMSAALFASCRGFDIGKGTG